ncbi:MAG: sugar-binding protein [Armatimonadaceae bacterium]
MEESVKPQLLHRNIYRNRTRLYRNGIAFSAFALITLFLAGCPSGETTTETASGTGGPGTTADAGKDPLKIAFVTNNASDFWTIARKGTEKADEELGDVTVEFQMPAEGTAADQRRVLDDLMAAGVDGVAVSPVDPANQTAYLNEVAAKIPLVTQDSDAPDSKRLCYVGTDNRAAGRQAGDMIKEAIPGGGKIMLFVGKKDAQNAQERAEGIREALQGSNIEILDIRTDDTDRVRAKANVSDTLVNHPDIAGLVGLWSYNGPAILSAVKDADKVGKVKIICFDEEDETLAGVKEGAIYGTVVQQPFEFGYQSVKLLAQVANGDRSAIPGDGKMIVPTLTIKQADVEEFATKLKELRGR